MTCAPDTDLRDWQLSTLKELVEIGMALARDLSGKAAAGPDRGEGKGAAPDPLLAFARVSRAIRLTIGLQTRIVEGPQTQTRREGSLGAPASPTDAELEDRRLTGQLRRSMAHYVAETAIEALEREAPETERLLDALDERFDRDDADFADIDVKDLAWTVCRDLGVDPGPDWWLEGWGIDAKNPPPGRGRMTSAGSPERAGSDRQRFGDRRDERPAAQRREDGVTDAGAGAAHARASGRAAKESLYGSSAASALQPEVIRSG